MPYVGVDGGFGASGGFSVTLLGSAYVTTEIIDLEPSERQVFDYGHIELSNGR